MAASKLILQHRLSASQMVYVCCTHVSFVWYTHNVDADHMCTLHMYVHKFNIKIIVCVKGTCVYYIICKYGIHYDV